MRALVSAELESFLAAERLPAELQVTLLPSGVPIPAGDIDGLISLINRPVHAHDMDRLHGLRVIANYGVGYDNIEVAAARDRGIAVTNTPGVLTEATAELTWALILAAARRLPEGVALARGGDWQGWHPTELRGVALGGRTLGIVGAGRIGREVGRKARAFGMDVVYWSRSAHQGWAAECGAARYEALHDLLRVSDVVTLHVSLDPTTELLIDRAALAAMKPGAILVNTSRGRVVDEPALIEALGAGRLRAAGLDVYAEEPTIPEPLRTLPNVVALPHLGSATEEARHAMWRLAWTNLLAGVRGEPVPNPV